MNPTITHSLRIENRNHFLEILGLHPTDRVGTQRIHYTTGDGTSIPPSTTSSSARSTADTDTLWMTSSSTTRDRNPPAVNVNAKQRLVFGNHTLRTLLLRHVLLDPPSLDKSPSASSSASSTIAAASSTSSKQQRSSLTKEEESWGIYPNNPWGIVGTRLLQDVASKSKPRDDETDEAQVILYFIRPDPISIQTVAKYIRTIQQQQQQQQQAHSSLILKHRIVFLPHIHSMAQRFLQDEGLVSFLSSSSSTTTSHHNNYPEEIQPILLPAGGISLHVMSIDLIPFDSDLITLTEYDSTIKETDVLGISSDVITMVAKSIIHLQDYIGIIPRIQSWGVTSERVLEKMLQLQVDEYQTQEFVMSTDTTTITTTYTEENTTGVIPTFRRKCPTKSTEVPALIFMDRKMDLITPMLTPLTYEGLLDDILGIDCGFIHVDSHVLDPTMTSTTTTTEASPIEGTTGSSTSTTIPSISSSSTSTNNNSLSSSSLVQSIPLNNQDSLYAEVRNQHVEKIGKFLQVQAKALKESHSTFTDKNKKDLSEIHQFVKQIPIFTKSVRLLTNHIHLAELIKKTTEQWDFRQRWQTERAMLESESCYDVLDDLIALQYPPFRLLKLFCLQSLTSGGIKASRFDTLKRDIIQTYGFEFLFVLQNLEKIGLLKRKDSIFDSTSPFASLRKSLNLILNDIDTSEPNDMAYVSSGYAPVSVRLIQVSMSGFSGKEEILRELPGRGMDILQSFPPEDFITVAKKGSPDQSLGVWAKRFSPKPGNTISPSYVGGMKPLLVVFYIGGVTYMEIAALRFLSNSSSFPYHIMILTTTIVDGSSLLESVR